MRRRELEASRRIALPSVPYELSAETLPFAFLFVRTTTVHVTDREANDAARPQPTSSDPSTTGADSSDPERDEEIDWKNDD